VTSQTRDSEYRWLLSWSESLDRDGREARLQRAEAALAFGKTDAALTAAEAALSAGPPPAGAPPRQRRERSEWLSLRERCLRRLGNAVEADRVRDEIFAFPPRDPSFGPKLIDLTQHYNASLYDGRRWHGDANLKTLAETLEPRPGIPFDIRGLIQLNSGTFPQSAAADERGKDLNSMYEKTYPTRVSNIRVDLRSKALHFLLAAAHSGSCKDGITVAQLVIHFEDGTQSECPLIVGKDLVDWALVSDIKKVPQEATAWVGSRPPRVLFRKTWTNPSPEKTITSFDFVSNLREASPFLVAATAE
jgi:hypothetical protein